MTSSTSFHGRHRHVDTTVLIARSYSANFPEPQDLYLDIGFEMVRVLEEFRTSIFKLRKLPICVNSQTTSLVNFFLQGRFPQFVPFAKVTGDTPFCSLRVLNTQNLR
jgi:hypothetical protein